MQKRLFIFLLSPVLFYACAGEPGENPADGKHDSTIPAPDVDSVVKSDSIVTASYHLSKEDSIRIADSVSRTKNQIRDFN